MRSFNLYEAFMLTNKPTHPHQPAHSSPCSFASPAALTEMEPSWHQELLLGKVTFAPFLLLGKIFIELHLTLPSLLWLLTGSWNFSTKIIDFDVFGVAGNASPSEGRFEYVWGFSFLRSDLSFPRTVVFQCPELLFSSLAHRAVCSLHSEGSQNTGKVQ